MGFDVPSSKHSFRNLLRLLIILGLGVPERLILPLLSDQLVVAALLDHLPAVKYRNLVTAPAVILPVL